MLSDAPTPVIVALIFFFIIYAILTFTIESENFGLSSISKKYYYRQVVFCISMIYLFIFALWAAWSCWIWLGFIFFIAILVILWYTLDNQVDTEAKMKSDYAEKLHF